MKKLLTFMIMQKSLNALLTQGFQAFLWLLTVKDGSISPILNFGKSHSRRYHTKTE